MTLNKEKYRIEFMIKNIFGRDIDFSNVEIVDTILTSNVNNGYFTIDVYKDSIITIKGTPDFVNYKFETNVDKFRLSKWIYEHNVVYSLFEFIFSK